jgi:hypothetical protein
MTEIRKDIRTIIYFYAGFEVITAVTMKSFIFLDITTCNKALIATIVMAGFLLGLHFHPEDGGDVTSKHRSTCSDYIASNGKMTTE